MSDKGGDFYSFLGGFLFGAVAGAVSLALGPFLPLGPPGSMVLLWGCGSAHGKIPNSGHSRTLSRGFSGSSEKNAGSPPGARTSSLAASLRNSAAWNVPLTGSSPAPAQPKPGSATAHHQNRCISLTRNL